MTIKNNIIHYFQNKNQKKNNKDKYKKQDFMNNFYNKIKINQKIY